MTSHRLISRRRLILLAAAGLGSYAVGRSAHSLPAIWQRQSSSDRLVDLLADRASARVVGSAYLRTVPAEASPAVLVARMGERLPTGVAGLDGMPATELRAFLIRAIDQDLRNLNIVLLNGWIVARTEARLYALAAV